MAIVNDQPGVEKDEDKDKQPIGGAPAVGGAPGGSGGGAPGGGGIGAPAQQKAPTSSGSFTDVGKYVDANRPNVSAFAGNVAGQASQEVDDAKQVFGQNATELENQIQGGVQNVGVSSNDSGVTNAADVNQFLKGPTYTGPEDSGTISTSGVQQAADLFNVRDTKGGQEAFLQQVLGDEVQDYSAGERNLDSLFLGRDQGARDIMNKAQTSANQSVTDATARKQGIDQAITDARGRGQANRAKAEADLTNIWDSTGGEAMFNEDPRYTDIANQMYDNLYGNINTKFRDDRTSMTKAEQDYLQAVNSGKQNYLDAINSGDQSASLEDMQRAASLEYLKGNSDFAGMLSGYDAKQEGVLQSLVDATGGTSMTGINTGAQGYLDRGRYDAGDTYNKISDYFSNSENAGLQYGGGGNYVPSSGNTSTTNSVVDTLSDAGAAIGMDPIGQTERLGNAVKGMFG